MNCSTPGRCRKAINACTCAAAGTLPIRKVPATAVASRPGRETSVDPDSGAAPEALDATEKKPTAITASVRIVFRNNLPPVLT